MNVQLVNPFIEATLYILDTTASVKVMALPPYLKKGTKADGEITGIVEMNGDLKGTVGVSFNEQCILGIVSQMFGEEMTEMNDEIKDAVGEIANMVAGQVTTKMGEIGKTIQVKFQEVVMGDSHQIPHIPEKPVVGIPFRTEKGAFTIEVCFDE